MTDHGYTPTRQEVQKRDVAVQAERHWFIARLRKRSELLRACHGLETLGDFSQKEADWLDAVIAERERP